MLIYVDIDDTICHYAPEDHEEKDYRKAIPYPERIAKIDKL